MTLSMCRCLPIRMSYTDGHALDTHTNVAVLYWKWKVSGVDYMCWLQVLTCAIGAFPDSSGPN